MKMMNEVDAWHAIAESFDELARGSRRHVSGYRMRMQGLCYDVDQLFYDSRISLRTNVRMLARINMYLDVGQRWAYPRKRRFVSARVCAALWLAEDARAGVRIRAQRPLHTEEMLAHRAAIRARTSA